MKFAKIIFFVVVIALLICCCAKEPEQKAVLGKYILAGGNHHSIAALTPDTVRAWGYNLFGQMGNQEIVNCQYQPVTVNYLTGVYEVASGDFHNLALLNSGEVMAWGHNIYGQLGLGYKCESVTLPEKVPALSGIVNLDAGGYRNAAVDSLGRVYSWGSSYPGDGTMTRNIDPALLSGIGKVKQVSVGGDSFTLLLMEDGRVMSWGRNFYGTLGLGSSGDGTNQTSPQYIPGLENVTQVAAGITHSLALLKDGTVMAWGYGGHGNLGNGSRKDSPVPVKVKNLRGVVQIAAGGSSLALLESGLVKAWGIYPGDGTGKSCDTPKFVNEIDDAVAIACGMAHCLVKLGDGRVLAWGWNYKGQLGEQQGRGEYVHSPVEVKGGGRKD
ncbi:hypothetical protein JXI42_06220 [bacterium]|nr:hypothetical protein [bacterium]